MASKSRRSHTAKGPSQRQLRVGETLRHALSEILIREDFFDPDQLHSSDQIQGKNRYSDRASDLHHQGPKFRSIQRSVRDLLHGPRVIRVNFT